MGTSLQSAEFLFGKARAAVLTLLYLNPSESFHVREIIRRVPVAASNVQRELKALEAEGLIIKFRNANQVHYRANQQSPIFNELREIITKTATVTLTIKQALLSFKDQFQIAFIYGSFARGDQVRSSDIDLMVIGDVSFRTLTSVLFPVQKSLGREINASVFSTSETKAKLKQKDPFMTEVCKGPKVFLFGNINDLSAMV